MPWPWEKCSSYFSPSPEANDVLAAARGAVHGELGGSGRLKLRIGKRKLEKRQVGPLRRRRRRRRQGSLHSTPAHCLVNRGFPLFWRKKLCSNWRNVALRSPGRRMRCPTHYPPANICRVPGGSVSRGSLALSFQETHKMGEWFSLKAILKSVPSQNDTPISQSGALATGRVTWKPSIRWPCFP